MLVTSNFSFSNSVFYPFGELPAIFIKFRIVVCKLFLFRLSPIVPSVALRTEDRRSLVRSPARPILFPRIDDSHCDRIHSSLTTVSCFDNDYVRKQPVASKEYSVEHWLKEFQESIDRCNGCCNITEILLKTALNTFQSINLSVWKSKKFVVWESVHSLPHSPHF